MMSGSRPARYPERFEIHRLEALGENPYLTDDDARRRYDDGKGLSVVAASTPPTWFLDVSVRRHRFSVTFYAPTRTPIPLLAMTLPAPDASLAC